MCAFGSFSKFLKRRLMRWLIARSTALIADDDGEPGTGTLFVLAGAVFDEVDAFDALDD